MSSLSNQGFLNQFRIDAPVKEVVLTVRGYEYPCIGEFKSRWSDIRIDAEPKHTAFLTQEGVISIVNPDMNAAIAYVTLDSYLYSYYSNENFRPTDNSFIRLTAHPRDPKTLYINKESEKDSVITFASDLLSQMPNAPFARDMDDFYRLMSYYYGHHKGFLVQHLGGGEKISPTGVRVYMSRLGGGTRKEIFDRLFDAPMLSQTAGIRQGFKDILGRIAERSTLLPEPRPLLALTR